MVGLPSMKAVDGFIEAALPARRIEGKQPKCDRGGCCART
jgi:hypothetical protein